MRVQNKFSEQLVETTYMLSLPSISEALEQSIWKSRGWTCQGKKNVMWLAARQLF
jgi:hypothetical protein